MSNPWWHAIKYGWRFGVEVFDALAPEKGVPKAVCHEAAALKACGKIQDTIRADAAAKRELYREIGR